MSSIYPLVKMYSIAPPRHRLVLAIAKAEYKCEACVYIKNDIWVYNYTKKIHLRASLSGKC